MSSTNRSAAREKHISDYYVTPLHTITEFMRAFTQDAPSIGFDVRAAMNVLDPCAGGDSVNPMAYPNALIGHSQWNIQHVRTIDIREDSLAELKGDYLTTNFGYQFDMTITNPPFNIAMDVIKKALSDTRYGGMVVMLLRLNFFGSKERQGFWQSNMPILTYVHTRRPKFLNTGGTDSIEYMHAVWQVGNPQKSTKMRIV